MGLKVKMSRTLMTVCLLLLLGFNEVKWSNLKKT